MFFFPQNIKTFTQWLNSVTPERKISSILTRER